MKKTYIGFAGLSLLLLLGTQTVQAQQGFGTDNPHRSAAVDIQSSKRGLLIPRVSLVKTTNQAPITAPETSLMVYNQATANDVTPGYYYWDGEKWARFAKQSEITEIITLDGDVTGKTGDTKVVAIQGTSISNVAPTANQVLTLVNGVWTPTTITSSLISDAKGITGTGITVGGTDNGAGSVLKDVTLSITHGGANQVMVTNADGTGTTWVDQKDIVKANETVTTVVDGTNTTVSSSVNPAGSNTTEYKVNVSNEAIQGAQKLTTVSAENGVKVTPVDMGNNTTDYNVAIDTDGGKAGDVLTVVDGGTSGDTKVEWKTPNYENIYTHDGTIIGTPENKTRTVDFGDTFALKFKKGEHFTQEFTFDKNHTGLDMAGLDGAMIHLMGHDNGKHPGSLTLSHSANASQILSRSESGLVIETEDKKDITFNTFTSEIEGVGAIENLVVKGDGGVKVSQINKPEFKGSSADKVVVADDEGVLKTVERTKIAPQFFYMPAVIFDTKKQGTDLQRDLYKEYVNQFTGGKVGEGNADYPIAHGADGYTMSYTGGIIGSHGAPKDIAVFNKEELYYYVTYYDTKVFANLRISPEGVLIYDIIGNATPASYMNIVFVIK
ncbi:hypothetical protein [Myroides odoratimimus]|uniref:hypothetical protein n=1 Tax=Myroides odoratimimus TaxID=76832 RepID=UPI00310108D4